MSRSNYQIPRKNALKTRITSMSNHSFVTSYVLLWKVFLGQKTDFRISSLAKFSLRISVSFEKALFSIISLLTRMKSGGLNYGASRKRGVNRLERLPKSISKIKLEIRFDDHNATLVCIPLRDNYRSRLDCTILRSIFSSIRKCH